MQAIEVRNLKRTYYSAIGLLGNKKKAIEAVKDVSFHIKKGELFGLLGPNGAGKTTTVKMLTTLLIPTAGEAFVNGYEVSKEPTQVQKRIGFIFGGERGLYWRLSAEDNLRYFASLYHVDPDIAKQRIPRLLELVGLKGRGNERVEGYSRGMKQRLHVARTLIHDPDILFLDEPTIGLDPVGAREFRGVIQNLQTEGKTILLTTHYMYEADLLCDRIGVINHGKIVALNTPENLKTVVKDLSVVEVELYGAPEAVIDSIRLIDHVQTAVIQARDQKQVLAVQTELGSKAVPEILKKLEGYKVGAVNVREPTLEDAYVRLVSTSSPAQEVNT
ncbi:MAG: ABC transporter ATP-binding protein [Spirochaetia bacterium]